VPKSIEPEVRGKKGYVRVKSGENSFRIASRRDRRTRSAG
jgi:hypothetical protein